VKLRRDGQEAPTLPETFRPRVFRPSSLGGLEITRNRVPDGGCVLGRNR
jgi:hypothetical protein